MSAPKHTPGPWAVSGREINGPIDTGVIVARIPEWGILADAPDPGRANARLIAAAPDLLAALEAVAEFWAGGDVPAELDAQMRAALAKARGTPPVDSRPA